MEKFDSKIHNNYVSHLPLSYFSLPIYLDFVGYLIPRNDEQVITIQDVYYPHEFPAVFAPINPKNWENFSVAPITDAEIKKIEDQKIQILIKKSIGAEYYYQTEDLLHPNSKISQRIRQFEKLYDYKIFNTYPVNKIKQFYQDWKQQKERSSDTFDASEEFFFFCLDNLSNYEMKQVYIEVEDKLVGFAWGIKHPADGWVGLHLKVNYQFKGLSRLLHQKRAELFPDQKYFSLGTGAHEPGIAQFKKELGPVEEKEYYYLLTGAKT